MIDPTNRRCRAAAWLALALPACLGAQSAVYRVTTVAGSGLVGDGGLAVSATVAGAEGLAIDQAGNLYFSENAGHRIRKVDRSGRIATVAGNGTPGFRGDGGPAAGAVVNAPYGLALDSAGNLYFADFGNQRVRRISAADGIISTVAGGGGGETGARNARLVGPRNLAIDRAGNLYIADFADHRVYRVTADGRIDQVAARQALRFPAGLAIDRDGASLFIADSGNRAILRLAPGATAATPVATLASGTPLGIALDPRDGSLLVAAGSSANRLLRLPSGGSTTPIVVAGDTPELPGAIRDVAVTAAGAVYFTAGRQVLRPAAAAAEGGAPVAVAGDGASAARIVENAPAAQSVLQSPMGVALDSAGALYVAEEGSKRVRRVAADGTIRTVAGGGLPVGNSVGDGGPATAARLFGPTGVAWDAVAGLRIADTAGHRIRGVLPSGNMHTVAGDGEPGFGGDGGPAAQARLNRPRGLAFDRAGNLYVADMNNHRIRRIAPSGFMATIAGTGVRGYAGDGGPAAQAQLNAPQGVAVDADGNVYIADTGNDAIRRVSPDGLIATLAGANTGTVLRAPAAVAVDPAGAVLIADTFHHQIRRWDPAAARLETLAGDGTAGYWGDDGPALAAALNAPTGLAVSPASGAVYVADFDNQRVRLLAPTAAPSLPPAGIVEPPEAAAPSRLTVTNAASTRAVDTVAPGMLATVYAAGLEPGLELRFDGLAARVLFAGAGQVNVEVPRALAAPRESIAVEALRAGGELVASARLGSAAAQPALFTQQAGGSGLAAALNQDGALITEANPAPRGSVATLFATGEGTASLASLSVRVGGAEAEVLWAGPAPGFPGLLQVNVRLPGLFTPPGLRTLTLATAAGETTQPGVVIALR